MKKIFVLLISTIVLNTYAQYPGGGGGRPPGGMAAMERPSAEQQAKHETKKMSKQLGLSNEQKEKYQVISLAFAEEREDLLESFPRDQFPPSAESREKMKAGMVSIEQRKQEQLQKFLTAEQLKKYKEIKESEKSAMMNQRTGRP